MNWEAISATSEALGAGAIIVTLVYLSIQLRENTKSIKMQSLDSTFKEWSTLLAEMQNINGVGGNYLKMLNGEELTSTEAHQLAFFYRRVLHENEKVQHLASIGAADSFNIESLERSLPAIVGSEFFDQFWSQYKSRYSDEFQAYISEFKRTHPYKAK